MHDLQQPHLSSPPQGCVLCIAPERQGSRARFLAKAAKAGMQIEHVPLDAFPELQQRHEALVQQSTQSYNPDLHLPLLSILRLTR